MNIQKLKEGRFLGQADVDPPILVTIIKVDQVDVALPNTDPEWRWAVYFQQTEKPMTLNKTNAQDIADIAGSEETDDWKGHTIVLWRDKNIMYQGKKVGGIRVRAPKPGYKAPEQPPEPVEETPPDDIPF